ncbi:MAG: isochorismatase family protein [Pseudomonadota bacterium]
MNIKTHRGFVNINPLKSVLLVIDMQNYFKSIIDPIIDSVKAVIDFAQEISIQTIYTKHGHVDPLKDAGMLYEWWDEHLLKSDDDFEIVKKLQPTLNDKIIEKNRYSAFLNTDLDLYLKGNNIKNLFISGVMTNCCCETTARDAFCRDYRVFFLEDCTNAPKKEMHSASILNLSYGFAYIVNSKNIDF